MIDTKNLGPRRVSPHDLFATPVTRLWTKTNLVAENLAMLGQTTTSVSERMALLTGQHAVSTRTDETPLDRATIRASTAISRTSLGPTFRSPPASTFLSMTLGSEVHTLRHDHASPGRHGSPDASGSRRRPACRRCDRSQSSRLVPLNHALKPDASNRVK